MSKIDIDEILKKRYVLKSYADSDYQGLIAAVKDYNYSTKADGSKELLLLIEFENGATEWRKQKDITEYVPNEIKIEQVDEKFKYLDKDVIHELKIYALAGICMGGIPVDYVCNDKKECDEVSEKIQELMTKTN